MAKLKKTRIQVKGMHCPSCDILISDKVRELPNVKEVKADHRRQEAEIYYSGHFGANQLDELNKKISHFGYRAFQPSSNDEQSITEHEALTKRLLDAGVIALVLFILFYIIQDLNLLPNFQAGSSLSFLTVFVLGIVASTSTCMATSGALFLATVGKLNVRSKTLDIKTSNFQLQTSNLVPALSFNLGRIISYGFFGFLAGLLGQSIVTNFQLSSLLTLVISFLMIVIGLDMAKIISLQSLFTQSFTSGLFQKLEHRLIKNPKKTAFLLGAITYLLPCGFTQTVQLYAIGLADPVKSAIIMMIFAVGTMPALLAIGFASSFTKSRYFPAVQKVMGTLVLLIGFYYVNNFLGIYGYDLRFFSQKQGVVNANSFNIQNGEQVITMSVNSSGYSPNTFTLKKDIPVRWQINGENTFGCQAFLVVPKLGIQKTIAAGQNLIEFTPTEEGTINFSCGMGMYRGVMNVVKG